MSGARMIRVCVDGFRGIDDAVIDCTGAVALFGRNGKGKTSILHAIRFALLGWVPGVTTKSGGGAAELVRDGADAAAVHVFFDNGASVSVSIQPGGKREFNVTRQDGRTTTARGDMWAELGIDEAHAAVCMQPNWYLDSKDLWEVLQGLQGEVDTAAIMDAVPGIHHGWVERNAKQWKCDLSSLDGWRAFGASAYEWRTHRKKALAEQESEVARLEQTKVRPPRVDGKLWGPSDVKAAEERLASAISERNDLVREKARAENAPTQDAIAQVETEADEAEADADAARADINRHTAEWAAIGEEYAAVSGRSAQLIDCVDMFERYGESTCPVCQQVLPEAAVQAIIDASSAATAAKLEMDSKREAVMVTRREAEQRSQHAHGLAVALRAKLTAMREEQPTRSVDELAPLCEAATEAVEVAESNHDQLVAYCEHNRTLQRERGCVATMHGELAALDWAVQQYHHGEALNGLATGGLQQLADRANAVLTGFGYELAFRIDGKRFVPTLNDRPVALCSEGERTLAAFGLAMGFADCGAPVLLDDMNALDAQHRRSVLYWLRDHPPVGGVVLAAAWQQSKTDWAAVSRVLSPLAVYWVENGTARLAAQAEVVA